MVQESASVIQPRLVFYVKLRKVCKPVSAWHPDQSLQAPTRSHLPTSLLTSRLISPHISPLTKRQTHTSPPLPTTIHRHTAAALRARALLDAREARAKPNRLALLHARLEG